MPTLAAPVQLIDLITLEPIPNPTTLLQVGDVTIATGDSAFVNVAALPTASEENNVDLIVNLTDAEIASDYEIRFHDPGGVWADIFIIVDLSAISPDDPAQILGRMVGYTGDPELASDVFETVMLMATKLVANVSSKCSGLAALDDETLVLINRNLAAHFYAQSNGRPGLGQAVKSDQVGDGVGRTWSAPAGIKGHGLQSTTYGQMALLMDTSGCLAAHEAAMANPRRKAKLKWLGKPRC